MKMTARAIAAALFILLLKGGIQSSSAIDFGCSPKNITIIQNYQERSPKGVYTYGVTIENGCLCDLTTMLLYCADQVVPYATVPDQILQHIYEDTCVYTQVISEGGSGKFTYQADDFWALNAKQVSCE